MKILVVCQYYYPEPFRITDICETLALRGNTVTVLTGLPNYPEGKVAPEYRHAKKRDEMINNVHIIRCFEIGRGKSICSRFLNYFSFPLSASRMIKRLPNDFDVIFVNQLSPVMMAWPALKYKRIHGTKVLLYCLDLWPASISAGGVKQDSLIYKLFLHIARKIYHSVDHIAVTSTMFKQYFKDVIGIDPEGITYLPQYAEDCFTPCLRKAKTDAHWNFMFAGNIGEAQSVDTIIKAANELKDNEQVIFHIVGDGSALADCKELVRQYGITNVLFYGRRPVAKMPQLYALADAMIVTMSNDEALSYTLPGKVQSYMAAGKPIIAACGGETKQVIEETQCGCCCVPGDYIGLSKTIKAFIESRSKIDDMCKHSALAYKETFSKDSFIWNLEDIMRGTNNG